MTKKKDEWPYGKEKVNMPERVGCGIHKHCSNHPNCKECVQGAGPNCKDCPLYIGPHLDCKACRQVNRERKQQFFQELMWQAGKIIHARWPDNLKTQQGVDKAKKRLTKQFYPWQKSATAKKVWIETLDTAARQKSESFVPVIGDKVELW